MLRQQKRGVAKNWSSKLKNKPPPVPLHFTYLMFIPVIKAAGSIDMLKNLSSTVLTDFFPLIAQITLSHKIFLQEIRSIIITLFTSIFAND